MSYVRVSERVESGAWELQLTADVGIGPPFSVTFTFLTRR